MSIQQVHRGPLGSKFCGSNCFQLTMSVSLLQLESLSLIYAMTTQHISKLHHIPHNTDIKVLFLNFYLLQTKTSKGTQDKLLKQFASEGRERAAGRSQHENEPRLSGCR